MFPPKLILLVISSFCFYTSDGLVAPGNILFKTTETFKLADLQYLEAKVECCGFCERLLVDSATGSSLIVIKGSSPSLWEDNKPSSSLPTCLKKRSDWVGRIIASGSSAQELIGNLREANTSDLSIWLLEYIRMARSDLSRTKTNYTSKTLLACVAQTIDAPAALTPTEGGKRLVVLDTIEDLYLLLLEDIEPSTSSETSLLWSNRPFQYSSAINPTVAEISVDILTSLCNKEVGQMRMLDPTCGSGTFLAMALSAGFAFVEGRDINQACVDGTQDNLVHIFPANRWEVRLSDASEIDESSLKEFDCVVANFPWGQNTISYYKMNNVILEKLAKALEPGTPCAFITKDSQIQAEMKRQGYTFVGDAHIPQKDFVLPRGKKKAASTSSMQRGTSNCVVSIVMSP